MSKGKIIRKIVMLGLLLAVLIALYVIGCNSLSAEVETDAPSLEPLPEYTLPPMTPFCTLEPIEPDKPGVYMPPYNSQISFRAYGTWLTANGSSLYLYEDGKTGSVPPNYVSHPYTDGDICDIQFEPSYSTFKVPYDGSNVLQFFINMNKTPISDFNNYSKIKIWVQLDGFDIRDANDQSIKLNYTIAIHCKLSGYDENGVYTSADYSEVYDRKHIENSSVEILCDASNLFTTLNRIDCTLTIECDLPSCYNDVRDSSWGYRCRSFTCSDRMIADPWIGNIKVAFLPNSVMLQDFVQSALENEQSNFGASAISWINDVLTLIVDPNTKLGTTRLTIPAMSLDMGDNSKVQYFNGGWFDMKDFSFNFGGVSYSGTDTASTIYSWCRTITSVLITIDFIALMFDMGMSAIKGSRFKLITVNGGDSQDEDLIDPATGEVVRARRRR